MKGKKTVLMQLKNNNNKNGFKIIFIHSTSNEAFYCQKWSASATGAAVLSLEQRVSTVQWCTRHRQHKPLKQFILRHHV